MRVIENDLRGLVPDEAFDLVVIGAGGAGLSAALFAALDGARVLIVERTGLVGGTTAWSAGTTWVPGTHHSDAMGSGDTLHLARLYLDHAVGDRAPVSLREAFLAHGRAAVKCLEERTELRYRPYPKHPDYLSNLPGATLAGRALEPLPFDGRLLGPLFRLLRPPIPEFTVLGGMMVDRTDIGHLLGMRRSWTSLRHALGLLARHAIDRLSHPRGTRLVMGNALVGRLLHSLSRHPNVTLALRSEVTGLNDADEKLAQHRGFAGRSLSLCSGQTTLNVQALRGVVLASGGFNRHAQWREQRLPGISQDWSPAAPGHTGQALQWATGLGAQLWAAPAQDADPAGQTAQPTHAFWAPVSRRQRADGSTAVFPHFVLDRAKPGTVVVNQRGERFVNESTSYHLFGLAMQAANQHTPTIPAYLVCDARALKAYGIGMVRPGGASLQAFLADGYLTQGQTLAELAGRLGIAAQGLEASVRAINRYAETGVDSEFHRGETAYERNLGDPQWPGPNPTLGAIREAPFYAVRLYPGDIGACTGLAVNEHAQVLDAGGRPLQGLYAIGNDMQSVMGGAYPAPGITIGPGTVFAYIAARHALATNVRAAP